VGGVCSRVGVGLFFMVEWDFGGALGASIGVHRCPQPFPDATGSPGRESFASVGRGLAWRTGSCPTLPLLCCLRLCLTGPSAQFLGTSSRGCQGEARQHPLSPSLRPADCPSFPDGGPASHGRAAGSRGRLIMFSPPPPRLPPGPWLQWHWPHGNMYTLQTTRLLDGLGDGTGWRLWLLCWH
jgi:hypothetical protein